MAKNVPTSGGATTLANGETLYEGRFVGTFEGDLTGNVSGNAATADALRQAMRITFAGDAGGSFQTNGSNATCNLTVTRADRAHEADHATTADTVTKAVNADHAAHAEYADHAVSADKAALADSATYADSAGSAQQASFAQNAEAANTAGKAKEADHAITANEANHATEADTALIAKHLENNGDPVPLAEHAKFADKANIALFDCYGRNIPLTYATKDEVVMKDEAFTEEDAKALFARKCDLILQATVSGKAWGYGYKHCQTLHIFIESLDVDENGNKGIYHQIVFIPELDLPDNPDTTKAYVTGDQVLWLYDINADAWKDVRSKLTPESQAILDKLSNFVDMSTDQWEIHGKKAFKDEVFAPIPSFEESPDHAVAVMSNVRYAYNTLKQSIDEIRTALGLGAEVGIIGSDFKRLELKENEIFEEYSPQVGEFAIFGVDEILAGIEVATPTEIFIPDPPKVPELGVEFDSLSLREDESFENSTAAAGEFNIYGTDELLKDIIVPPPVTIPIPTPPEQPQLGDDFSSVNLLEDEQFESSAAEAGQFNVYGTDEILKDVTVAAPEKIKVPYAEDLVEGEFYTINFEENQRLESIGTPKRGVITLAPADDALAGIKVDDKLDTPPDWTEGYGNSTNEFHSIRFDESGNFATSANAATGVLKIEPAEDALAGIKVSAPIDDSNHSDKKGE